MIIFDHEIYFEFIHNWRLFDEEGDFYFDFSLFDFIINSSGFSFVVLNFGLSIMWY